MKFVHAFVIVLKGNQGNNRDKKDIRDMLTIFSEIFSKSFWSQTRLVATFYSFGQDAIDDRNNKGNTEKSWEKDKIKQMEEKIPYLKEVSYFL